MRPRIITGCVAVLASFVLAGPVSAHHSVTGLQTLTPIHVKGTVVRYTWANPHSTIVVAQKTETGETIRWALESSAPIRLLKASGFTKTSFKPGDVIEACGFETKAAVSHPSDRDGDGSDHFWLEGADRVMAARLLLTADGPKVHWSHYGPLEACISKEELDALSR